MPHVVNILGSICDIHVGLINTAIGALNSDPTLLLEIRIDSDGGDPDQAKIIYDSLSSYRDRTTTVTNSKCMSCAVLIFLSGNKRQAGATADFMIHPTSWRLWGAYSFLKTYRSFGTGDLTLTLSEVYTLQAQLNTASKRLNEIEDYTDAIFAERTRLTKQQFQDRRNVRKDQHFTPEESIRLGISTKLI